MLRYSLTGTIVALARALVAPHSPIFASITGTHNAQYAARGKIKKL
jgi:hypothetical protein